MRTARDTETLRLPASRLSTLAVNNSDVREDLAATADGPKTGRRGRKSSVVNSKHPSLRSSSDVISRLIRVVQHNK